MSHEGIRIVSEETARRESAAEQRLPAEVVTPLKVRVMKSEGTGVAIEWKDGHHSAWNFAWLRAGCPCATCNEERNASGRKPGEVKPSAPTGPLVLYQAPPRPVDVTPVGKYAIRFKWNDGHESGIYSWDYLRRVCQCDDCRNSSSI
ncbi:gamma-butyrobetaine hydroxylase-like domain-containing protein [Granulicella tundricola]|uniref:Gamma-butyrobetaine hydroxylase-like N-terminal domain-containing protein n=1 Tax=Granulicella tundricola (strain ATCC BAA-1859 / DSM 23138 / MP5ACTX9) TaxID=1198114 RepID=E8WZA6_GRATM|nr:DUF971 domain-containing protein [Granulicella tundricola]ADW67708.1 hypothetical protein AciX9_0637 [Granulicella tundricola MP5ACTX9]